VHSESDLPQILAYDSLLDISNSLDSVFVRFINIDLLEDGVQEILVL
jgi:hypothetical protein